MNRIERRLRAPLTRADAKNDMDALVRLQTANATVEQLKFRLRRLMDKLPTRTVEFQPGAHFWRGVAWASRPTKVTELSYPPAERVKSYQRANRPGEPRFYCSVGGHAPFYELRMQVGQCIALSKWRVRSRIIANHVGFTAGNFARLGTRRSLPDAWGGTTQTETTQKVHDFIAEGFSRDVPAGLEDQYKMSVAIAELFTAGTKDFRFQGLVYPALAAKGNHDNVVLFPQAVASHLELVRAVYFEVTAIEPDVPRYHAQELAVADRFDDGEIHWVDQPPTSTTWEPGVASGV